jgi:DNA recombination protein RmuC
MDLAALGALIVVLAIGFAVGWFVGSRPGADWRKRFSERDAEAKDLEATIKRMTIDLAAMSERTKLSDGLADELASTRRERDEARIQLASASERADQADNLAAELRVVRRERDTHRAEVAAFERGEVERQRAHDAQIEQLKDLEVKLEARFGELAGKAVQGAHDIFLKRAEEKLGTAGEQNEQRIRTLLKPVETTLKRYEEGLKAVEKERVDHYAGLREAVEQVRAGQAEVKTEAAKLTNALRAAPKTRGRWGEQQFKNLIEISGLSGFVDFEEEVSVQGAEGTLRPDFVIRLPGNRQLVVDVKCSLDAYLQAADCIDPAARQAYHAAHGRAVSVHVEALSRKSYWEQFPKAPDFVIMYIPGDNFISAALENDMDLWERAARKRVIICGPSTFLPMARTVAGIWRQEKLAEEAQRIGLLGKDMYDRLANAAEKLKTVGSGLGTAVRNYNEFVSSFESRVLVTGRKFRDLNVEVGAKEIKDVEPVELLPRYAETAAPVLNSQRQGATEPGAAPPIDPANDQAIQDTA